ncbi:helix-turn-helix transcriptional regulator [Kitasatospora sp. NA04385]|uniref:helix-turn-helix domain-containing protein n=1 Tax=Kitasatospora sp. NA04385 TaxID=2742135 RepID=UPI0015916490|nr:helix-turn-helix transcriptional regulator [Kitasatospora sp. NA04385]QKW20573.1 helix-turn-helix transcriptional regulator [Kitasatospora sp. NA04385]
MEERREGLVALRRRAGYTQEGLARDMGVDRTTPGRWERGKATPYPWQLPKLAMLLKVSPDGLAEALQGRPGDQGPTGGALRPEQPPGPAAAGGPGPGSAPVGGGFSTTEFADGGIRAGCRTADGRIVFLTLPRQARLPGGAVLPGAARPVGLVLPDPPDTFPELTSDRHPVESLAALRRSLVECDNVVGPRDVVATAHEHVRLVQRLRTQADGRDRLELLRTLAEYAEFCSWLHQDSGDHQAAQYWADRAVDWANACGDHDLTTYITARKAQLAGDMLSGADAVDLADYAQRLARPGTRLSAMAAVYGAHGQALLGDGRAAQHTFDRALDLLADPADSDTGRGRWLSAGYVEAQRARALALLGHHREAAAGYEQAIRALPFTFRRDRGVYLARLARSQVAAVGPEQAAATGRAAAAIGAATGSGRILTELAALDELLRPRQSLPEVQHFRDTLDGLLLHET